MGIGLDRFIMLLLNYLFYSILNFMCCSVAQILLSTQQLIRILLTAITMKVLYRYLITYHSSLGSGSFLRIEIKSLTY